MKRRQKILLLLSLVMLITVQSCMLRIDSTKNNSELDRRSLHRKQKTFLTHKKWRGPRKMVVWYKRKQMLKKKDRASKK